MIFCKNCGWMYSGKYCPKCGTEYTDESEMDTSEVTLSSEVTDDDREAEARRILWNSMHAENVDISECVSSAKELKIYVPEDYYANFAIVACGGNDRDISRFLNRSSYMDLKKYADAVMDYISSHMTTGLYCAVSNYMERAQNAYELIEYHEIVESYIPETIRKNKEKEKKQLQTRKQKTEKKKQRTENRIRRKENVTTWFSNLWESIKERPSFVIYFFFFAASIILLIIAAVKWSYDMVLAAGVCLTCFAVIEFFIAMVAFASNDDDEEKGLRVLTAVMFVLAVILFIVGIVFECVLDNL